MSPVLEVSGVTVRRGDRAILDDVTVNLDEGEFAGLIGSNGAGKTTLLKVILGLIRPDAGQVSMGPRGSAGYVPQRIELDPDMPLRAIDLVGLGVDGHRLGWRRAADRRRRAEDALEAAGVSEFAGSRVGRLSGGEQQKVMIAHALAGSPRVLLLDEPLANLDISSSDDIVETLNRVSKEQRVAVLMSAHDMNPLLPAMDRVVYMVGGRVATGTTDEVVRTDVLSDLYRHPVEVIRAQGRVLVVGGDAETHCH